jgi:hypothetical protein
MKRILFPVLISFLLIPVLVSGQKKLDFSGHLQNLNTVMIQDIGSQWYSTSSIYNRLNLKWYLHQNWTFSAGDRNVMNYGQLIYLNYPDYSGLLVRDEGLFDLTATLIRDSSYIFYSNLDRLNLKFSKGKFEVIAGRQRINLGINLVWNPNDIFNTFSYYDFDYIERPGCDAINIQYYTGVSSSVQAAVKMDADNEITAAGIFRFNNWNYDFQVIGGLMENDLVIGGGWSGNIKTAGFTGEASYFRDKNNFSDSLGYFVLSSGINYTFKNSLFIHGSVLYNDRGTTGKAGMESSILNLLELSPKTLSFARASIFGQVAYPLSPLIKVDLSAIFNPYDKSVFIGPNADFSLSDNIGLLVMAQLFIGESGTEFGDYGQLYYIRLKWAF